LAGFNVDSNTLNRIFDTSYELNIGQANSYTTNDYGFSVGKDVDNRIFMGVVSGSSKYEFKIVSGSNQLVSFDSDGNNEIADWEITTSQIRKVDSIYLDSGNDKIWLSGSSYANAGIGLSGSGEGFLAKGNISWDQNGNVTLDPSVQISYGSVTERPDGSGYQDNFDFLDVGSVNFDEINYTSYSNNGNIEIKYDTGLDENYLRIGDNTGDDEQLLIGNKNIPFDPNKWYRARIKIRQIDGSGTHYVGFAGIAEDGETLIDITGSNSEYNQHTVVLSNSSLTNSTSFTDYTGYIHGYDATGVNGEELEEGKVYNDVKFIRPYISVNRDGQSGTVDILSFTIEEVTAKFIEGNIESTRITSTIIEAPTIAGNTGKFSGSVTVGHDGDGITVDGTNKRIYIGDGSYNDSNTPFYVSSGSASNFSLGDKLTWNGSILDITGVINANYITTDSGSIGG